MKKKNPKTHSFSVFSEQAREEGTAASVLACEESSFLYLQGDLERQACWPWSRDAASLRWILLASAGNPAFFLGQPIPLACGRRGQGLR